MTSAARSRWVAHRRYMIEHARGRSVKCYPMVAHRVEPEHGTRARYVHRTLRCRCPQCTAANAAYIARYRHDRAPWQPRTWYQQQLPGV